MKKKLFIFIFLFVFGLGGIFAFNSSPTAFVNAENNTSAERFIIRSYGDSIAYGLNNKFTDLIAEGKDPSSLDESEFTDQTQNYASIFSSKYCSDFEAILQLKGVSGDTTTELLADLTPYVNADSSDDPVDMQDFKDTDVVTLCIGANNVLGPALDNLGNYISETLTDEDYRIMLQEGLDTFAEEYPKILQAFEGKKVVVMTIFNPYKYLTLTDMDLSSLGSLVQSVAREMIDDYDVLLQQMIATSMEYLNGSSAIKGINEIIRESASDNVYVADIWNQFETFSKDEYLQYINANMSNVKLESTDISGFGVNMDSLMEKFTTYCDPHPTIAGHGKIAEKHSENFKYFRLVSDEDFSVEKEENEEISFRLISEIGNFTYKLFKEDKTLLKETNNKLDLIVEAYKLEGKGEVYVEVYNSEGEKIYTTNSVAYNVILKQTQSPVEPSEPEEELAVSISAAENINGTTKESGEMITIQVDTNAVEQYNYVLVKKVDGVESQIESVYSVQNSAFEIDASVIEGEGELFVEVYSGDTKIYTSSSISYNVTIKYLDVSISTTDSLTDVKVEGDTVKVSLATNSDKDLVYKLYKFANETESEIAIMVDSFIDVIVSDILGEGRLYVKVYENDNLVFTTNELTYNISLMEVSISASESLAGVKDYFDKIQINIENNSTEGFTYRLYKKEGGQSIYLAASGTNIITIDVEKIVGEGNLFVDVYRSGQIIYQTNQLEYAITMNEFSIESEDSLIGVCEENQNIVIIVKATNTNGYTFKLYKNSQLLKTSSNSTISIKSNDVDGIGEFYVEVYKSNEKIYTTNSLNYNFVVGSFTLASSTDLQNVSNPDQSIVFNVNSKNIVNPTYRLVKESDNKTIILQTNATGKFTIHARQLEGKGKLYVEVYSNDQLFTTTNMMEYNLAFESESNANNNQTIGESLFYVAAAIVGLSVLIGAVVALARLRKRNPF